MRILHLSTHEKGGAGHAARSLYAALEAEAPELKVGWAGSNRQRPVAATALWLNHYWNEHFLKSGQPNPEACNYFTTPWIGEKLAAMNGEQWDVIHLHWVHNWLSMVEPEELACPVVVTLHDEGAFTGGCHYTAGCDGHTQACMGCPQISPLLSELPPQVLEHRVRWADRVRPIVVTPTRWLAQQAARSRVFRNSRIEIIPYAIDLERWPAIGREQARQMLSLDPGKDWILLGAESLADRRKNIATGLSAIRALIQKGGVDANRLGLLVFGAGEIERIEGLEVRHAGFQDDQKKMATLLSAASIYLHPAKEDNQPLAVMEAMASQTPVVASRVGGVGELLDEGNCGWLAAECTACDLATTLESALNHSGRSAALARAARQRLATCHSPARIASAHYALYESCLESRNASIWRNPVTPPRPQLQLNDDLMRGLRGGERAVFFFDVFTKLAAFGEAQMEQVRRLDELEYVVGRLRAPLSDCVQALGGTSLWGQQAPHDGLDLSESILAMPAPLRELGDYWTLELHKLEEYASALARESGKVLHRHGGRDSPQGSANGSSLPSLPLLTMHRACEALKILEDESEDLRRAVANLREERANIRKRWPVRLLVKLGLWSRIIGKPSANS